MKQNDLELISDGHGLLEGPVFEPGIGLFVADATKGGVLIVKPGAKPEEIIAHRRGIGGMAVHINGGLVVSGHNVAYKNLDTSKPMTQVLLSNDPKSHILGFNDLVTDEVGRIYVGSLAFTALELKPDEVAGNQPTGKLHCIDLDGSVHEAASGVLLTNGLGFSPDGKKLYQADTLRRELRVFDVASDGTLHNDKCFAKLGRAMPDGLAVAEDGSIWVALYFGSAVVVFTPDGKEKGRIAIDVPMVTSVCFGGEDWRDLYIVTGPSGTNNPVSGRIYRVRTDVPGRRRPKARVRLPI